MYSDPTRSSQAADFSATGPIGQQFTQGASVYDVNGDKVGTIDNVEAQSNSIVIKKGLFFPKDITVPMSAIQRADADGVYLGVTKHDVSSGDFSRGGQATSMGMGTTDARAGDLREGNLREGDVRVPVREEELQARKLQEEQGRVRVHKDVAEQEKTISAPVTHEELRVERQPVDRPANLPSDAWQEKDIEVPLRGEELTAEKRARVGEEVHLQKQPVTDEQQISDTVRKERVRLDNEGDVSLDERASDQQWTDTQRP